MSQTELQAQSIINLITTQHVKKIYGIEVLSSTHSTNDYLAEKYNSEPKTVAICLAEKQTHGKGTQNKIWNSPNKKGIYLSFTWDISNKGLNIAPASIIVGAAIARLLNKYKPKHKIALKWPNDLYADGKKLGGILVEGYAQTGDIWHVIIGIGVNIHSDISLTEANKIALEDITDMNLDRNQITAAIMNECINLLEEADVNGLSNTTQIWNKHDMLQGKTISVISANKQYTGKNLGICEQGLLKILVEDNILKLSQAKIIEY